MKSVSCAKVVDIAVVGHDYDNINCFMVYVGKDTMSYGEGHCNKM